MLLTASMVGIIGGLLYTAVACGMKLRTEHKEKVRRTLEN